MSASASQPHSSSSSVPPRTLNVQKFAESRAAELKSIHSIVAERLKNDFRSRRSKRRRTTGYDNRGANNRFGKRRRVGGTAAGDEKKTQETDEKQEVPPPRRIRRRIELRKNTEVGFSTSGDGTKRLRTHVWHAKRFTMTKLWGFHLPLHLQGRGRGSRALLKKVKHGVVVHDASYCSAVQLEGPEDLLLSIMNTLLVPSQSSDPESTSSNILSGLIYGSAMLHHCGSAYSQSIAPVTYMWQPRLHGELYADEQQTDTCSNQEAIKRCAPCRKLWVWVHPAAFREGYDALRGACETQTDLTGRSVSCISLEDHLGKIELIGSQTFEILQKILHPITCFPENLFSLHKSSVGEADAEAQDVNATVNGNEDKSLSSAIISLTIKDPRISTEDTDICEAERPNNAAGSLRLSCSSPGESNDLLEHVSLWEASKGIHPPEEESHLCHEKYRQRLQSYCITGKSSLKLDASDKGRSSRICPIMLLKNHAKRNSLKRCSIVLPLSWIRAFWTPLVSHGCYAIGLTEKHWIACDIGLPDFPSDFPDSNAYSALMEIKAAASEERENLRPPCMRSLKVPVLPPWGCVGLAFADLISKDAQSQSEVIGPVVNDSSVRLFDFGNFDIAGSHGHCAVLGGFVARTSFVLTNFLNHVNGSQLLLFPKVPDVKNCISKCMRDENILTQVTDEIVPRISSGPRLCFLRVRLHAYKEGVFEEGAVVCAPLAADILLWTVRSGENNGVHLPHSSLGSYFIKQPSGEWGIQIPEDPKVRESYRPPIGFVTTGFVRGSKKPAAVALCEAVLLARLRAEQWKAAPTKQRRREIYVLVRNLKSTAYRLALATIVLEEQEQDVEYI